jgi:hypothetical protein
MADWKWTLHRKIADDRKAETGEGWIKYLARINNRGTVGTVYHLNYLRGSRRFAQDSGLAKLEKTLYCDAILDAIETDAEGSAD